MVEPRDTTLHALNNMLGKILGSTELALDLTDDPALRAELTLIADTAEQAGDLVIDLAERSPPDEPILWRFL